MLNSFRNCQSVFQSDIFHFMALEMLEVLFSPSVVHLWDLSSMTRGLNLGLQQ